MEMTKINIQNEANVNAVGTHVHHSSKPVICIETGEVFASLTDAAEAVGTSLSNMSSCLTGKSRRVKGKHYCYLSRATESLDAIVARLRETSALEEAGKKWMAYEAEQERIRKEEEARLEAERKAKEEYETKKRKLEDKILRRRKVSDRMKQGWNDAISRQMEAEREYEELTGHAYGLEENE